MWESSRWKLLVIEVEQEEKTKIANEDAEEAKKEADRGKYVGSPEYSKEEACYAQRRIRLAKAAIADEKSAAKHSGIVSKGRLHKLGQQIQNFQKLLISHKALYKKRSSKSWKPSLCKN